VVQVVVLPLELPRKALLPPNIRPTVSAARLGRALFKGEPNAVGIGLGRRTLSHHHAEVVEKGLGAGALGESGCFPLLDEERGSHAWSADFDCTITRYK
jgi:hypothetical protein